MAITSVGELVRAARNGRSQKEFAAFLGVKQSSVSRYEIGKVRIPRSSGHPFHEHLTTDSTVIRPPIPRVSDH